eukprot:03201_4
MHRRVLMRPDIWRRAGRSSWGFCLMKATSNRRVESGGVRNSYENMAPRVLTLHWMSRPNIQVGVCSLEMTLRSSAYTYAASRKERMHSIQTSIARVASIYSENFTPNRRESMSLSELPTALQ